VSGQDHITFGDRAKAHGYLIEFLLLQLTLALPKEKDSDESPLLRSLRRHIEEDISGSEGVKKCALDMLDAVEEALREGVQLCRQGEAADEQWRKAEQSLRKRKSDERSPI